MTQESAPTPLPDERPDALDHRFEALLFDWDGTAVTDRGADVSSVRRLVEGLCEMGMDIGIVSGTSVGNVDQQLAARPSGPGTLWLLLDRGSSVYRVAPDGPELHWQPARARRLPRRRGRNQRQDP